MIAMLLDLLGNPTLLAVIAGALGLFGFGVHQRRAGAKSERAKQQKKEQRARDIADDVEDDIGTIPPDRRREELGKWSED